MESDKVAAQLPRSTNRTAPTPNAPKATPKRMKDILEALRKNQKKQTDLQSYTPNISYATVNSPSAPNSIPKMPSRTRQLDVLLGSITLRKTLYVHHHHANHVWICGAV